MTTSPKKIHSIILDAGPIIKGEPSVSSLLQQCEQIITTPAVLAEIRDQATRARLQNTLIPFLKQQTPKAESIQIITDFARKTGDYAVLSRTDLQLLALTYDIECERNGGDWRLRKTPGQKSLNGSPPANLNAEQDKTTLDTQASDKTDSEDAQTGDTEAQTEDREKHPEKTEPTPHESKPEDRDVSIQGVAEITENLEDLDVAFEPEIAHEGAESEGDDEEGWITPSNIKRKQLEENNANASKISEPKVIQAALITTDFAMQNVLLQMNLNLMSASLQRVKHVKTFVLRCYACFNIVRDMEKQFCPRCGKDTLTRVSCTTDEKGVFRIHLKKNYQHNTRGDRYSVPKAVHGASNHRVKGGGKGGWGNDLILSEDQKEYTRAIAHEKRQKMRDLMDEDFLPSILSGDRPRQSGRPQVGAGRNVNSKKR